MSEFRKGSMGAADEKTAKTVAIVFTAIFTVLYLLFVIPSNLYTHYYFSNAGWWKFLAIPSIAAHYYFIWVKFKDMEDSAGQLVPASVLIFFGWFVLNVMLLAGWTFNLPSGA